MATIGLDSMYYAIMSTSATDTSNLFGTPKRLAGAISVDLSVSTAEAKLYADDGVFDTVKEFSGGTISLGIADLSDEALTDLTGCTKDAGDVIVNTTGDASPVVALGYRAKKSDGTIKYYWLYNVKFGPQGHNLKTKGDSIDWNTPAIEGIIGTCPKLTHNNGKPWKAEVTSSNSNTATTSAWFDSVYISASTTFDA